ncbi:MAG: metallophosphoesterase, partial [Lysobacterales bacterium]
AIGDLHGDYDQYIKVMQSAGLLDRKDKWAGGRTHLVQLGDITDRGADSRKIIDHLTKVARQAKRKGGYVHMLIGNHEAMNVTGDLRYVTPGEFQAFQGRNSARLQELQWQAQISWMRANIPEFEQMDLGAYRQQWEQQVPLGWVEHRGAWQPGGDYFNWVRDNPVAVKVNDTVFLHGGISAKYCKLSLQEMTERVIAALESYDPAVESIVDDQEGPLWYRGMATEDEDGIFSQTLDNILERYGAQRVVIGHTPTGGVVWPRFDGRVLANDTGIGAYYGAHVGILELTADGTTAIYGDSRIPVPTLNSERMDYLRAVIEADPEARLVKTLAPATAPALVAEGEAGDATEEQPLPELTPGTCR